MLLPYSTFPPKFALTSAPWKQDDRIETLTQCAEWSQFVVDYFLLFNCLSHR